jgi:cytochrome d ubiquinol oxidase subunit I
MIALGMFFIGITALGAVLRWRGRLFEQRWLMRAFVAAVLGPLAANQLGWVAAEVGRQPWVVYGLLKTADAVSPAVPPEHVLASILLFGFVYVGLLALWLFVLNAKIQMGPEPAPSGMPSDRPGPLLGGVALLDSTPQKPPERAAAPAKKE